MFENLSRRTSGIPSIGHVNHMLYHQYPTEGNFILERARSNPPSEKGQVDYIKIAVAEEETNVESPDILNSLMESIKWMIIIYIVFLALKIFSRLF